MTKIFLQSIHDPKLKFQVLSFNKETQIGKLKGDTSEFEEPLTKERMDKYGYKLEKVEEDE